MKPTMTKTLLLSLIVAFSLSGCAKLMGNLRRDLDDDQFDRGPTVGGMWSERGFLQESFPEAGYGNQKYNAVGHSERGPASEMAQTGRQSWMEGDRYEANVRDRYRRGGSEMEDEDSNAPMPNVTPATKRLYKNGHRATRADFLDESQNEGSLWAADGQTNFFFSKNKVRGLGDIVTVNLENEFVRDIANEVRRSLTTEEKEMELGYAQDRLNVKYTRGLASTGGKDAVTTSAAAPQAQAGTPAQPGAEKKEEEPAAANSGEAPAATWNDVDLTKAIELKQGDTMMAEIIERYPNGNYKIRGTKKINYKHGSPRLLSLIAVVKGSDISEEDVLNSGKLYEYRLEAIR